MKEVIDARGLACPQPVILTKNKMKEFTEIEVIVDNETAFENISRLAASSGYTITSDKRDGVYYILLVRNEAKKNNLSDSEFIPSCSNTETVVVISSDAMGSGDDELGIILMKAFLNTLAKIEKRPSKVILYNAGVKLVAEGSGSEDDLAYLADNGVELLICGTCVNYYNIKDSIKIGTISNMFDILNTMSNAGRIIKP